VQAPPSLPQASSAAPLTHVPALTQPPAHWHCWLFAHVSPASVQSVHAAPPVPHAVLDVPPVHVLPTQQPDGHDAFVQTQIPPEHA
jgi:hypothetical protein